MVKNVLRAGPFDEDDVEVAHEDEEDKAEVEEDVEAVGEVHARLLNCLDLPLAATIGRGEENQVSTREGGTINAKGQDEPPGHTSPLSESQHD